MENQNTVKIVGIKKTPNKNRPGQFYYNYYAMQNFSDFDQTNSEVQGVSCSAEFASVDIGCKVGDEVELKFTRGYQDRATLIGCTVIRSAAAAASAK